MRCLVTGADGFLGANLCQRLLADGHEVTGAALSRKNQTSLDALKVHVRVEYGDITDAAYVDRLINAYEPEWIFHLAAVSIVRIADANAGRAIRTNVLGTLNVCEAAQRYRHVKQVVVASSDKAYGDHGGRPYTEGLDLRPTGAYELSKAAGDQLARYYGAVVTRCANLFGPADLNWSRLVPGSCKRAAMGQAPIVHAGAWEYQREWLGVESAVSAYLLLAQQGEPGQAYNIGSGDTATAGHVALGVALLADAPRPVEGPELRAYEIPAQELCSDRLRGLGWRPEHSFEAALAQTVRWYRQYCRSEVLACAS